MNKKFLKSVVAGVFGLSLIASCNHHSHKDSHNCGAKNGCASKKDDANKCSSKKESKKEVKTEKKAKKGKVETKKEVKTEEKTN